MATTFVLCLTLQNSFLKWGNEKKSLLFPLEKLFYTPSLIISGEITLSDSPEHHQKVENLMTIPFS